MATEIDTNNYSSLKNIGVIGGGSWGTAISLLLASKGYSVDLWIYEQELVHEIETTRQNKIYLPGFELPDLIHPTNSLEQVVRDKKILFSVVPSHFVREMIPKFLPYLNQEFWIISATKGIETTTCKRMSQVYNELIPDYYNFEFAVLSGPTFAVEVASKSPTAAVISSSRKEVARCLQQMFHTEYFRLYRNYDPIGVELGGTVKNVMAIAAGISDGIGYGNNTRAALITRGLMEIMRLGMAMGADPMTFSGLAGLGDLILTCTSTLSRNYSVGHRLGSGESLKKILGSMQMVAEGIKNAQSVISIGDMYKVDLPITRQVYSILFLNKDPIESVLSLLGREPKNENLRIARTDKTNVF